MDFLLYFFLYINSRAHSYTVTWNDFIGICILRWKLKEIFLMATQSDPNVQSIYCIIFAQYTCGHGIFPGAVSGQPHGVRRHAVVRIPEQK